MKILAGITLAALIAVGNLSATTIAVVQGNSNYGSFASPPSQTASGILNFSAVNFGALSTITGVTLILETDYTGPLSQPLQIVSTFTPNGSGQVNDTLTTNYINPTSESYTDTAGLTFVTQPNGTVSSNGVPIVSGFNMLTSSLVGVTSAYGSFAIAYTSTITQGTTSGASVEAEVVYTYTTSSAGGTPEPVSMILFGSGLLAVSLIGRKKFFARK